MAQTPTYVSSSGQLSSPPLTRRVYDALRDYAEMGYLFFDTLITPIVNPNATAPAATPRNTGGSGGSRLGGGGGGGGSGGGGGGRGGNHGSGGSGFMTMSDLRGGPTVNACRSACG